MSTPACCNGVANGPLPQVWTQTTGATVRARRTGYVGARETRRANLQKELSAAAAALVG